MFKDYYLILEIKYSASQSEIKESYNRLSLKYKLNNAKYLSINEAYKVLSNEKERQQYNIAYIRFYKIGNQTFSNSYNQVYQKKKFSYHNIKPYIGYAIILIFIIVVILKDITDNSSGNRPKSGNIYSDNDSIAKSQIGNTSNSIKTTIDTSDLGWDKKYYVTGSVPSCYNFTPKYKKSLNNKLEVSVGSNTDAVIKLIDENSNKCIRYVYVRSGDTFDIKHIPLGSYYLKIAYGNDWRQKIQNRKCYGKFIRDALYEKGTNLLNFTKTYGAERIEGNRISKPYSLMSYSLTLNVIKTNIDSAFHSNSISEEDFNE